MSGWDITLIAAVSVMGDGELESLVREHPEVRVRAKYVAIHRYAPHGLGHRLREGKAFALEAIDPAEAWLALAATPGCYEDGVATGFGSHINFLADLGYQAAGTEWNWNGYGKELNELKLPKAAITPRLPLSAQPDSCRA